VTGRVRRWYRIAAAITSGVALAALVLGASGQLFAPAVAPGTAKAVLVQDAGAQNAGLQPPADDAPRRCARSGRTSRRPRPRARLRSGCQPAGPAAGNAIAGHRGSGYPTAGGSPARASRMPPCRVTGTGSS
jgi:hypothetical protein